MKLLKAIRSTSTAFITAVSIILFVQVPHLTIVFAYISELPNYWAYIHGALYAISVDLGVLFFAVRGKTMQTVIFMLMSAVITLDYYYKEAMLRISESNYLGAFIVFLVSVAPSVLIYFISEEMKTKRRLK